MWEVNTINVGLPREQKHYDFAKGVNISAGVGFHTVQLLLGRVSRCARSPKRLLRNETREVFRDSKIANLPKSIHAQDVSGLEITMDNADFVQTT
jgi:hypothetical protein